MAKARSKPVRVLVTGSEGFVGKPTIKILEAKGGYKVIPFDFKLGKTLTTPSHLKALEYDAVIHLAAVSSTPWAESNPDAAFSTNIYGTYNLLLDSLDKKVSRFVYASSSRILSPTLSNPYIISKLLQEQVTGLFSKELSIVGLRYASIYGPEGFARKHSMNVLNQIIKAALDNTTVRIFGDGSQTRDFVFVDDVAMANVKALEADTQGIFEIGTGKQTRLLDAVKAVDEITGRKVNVTYGDAYPNDYMHEQRANREATEEGIGFQAQVDLYEGIKRCVQSY
ncbi:MAG: NAD-dependent epimerase/dehydratase family protein [Chloroflexi bacterium]|nr:NAD-dependent epimerase/dehydratase family protein [Chloroflexota bacterium]